MGCKPDTGAIQDFLDSLDGSVRPQVDNKIQKITDNPEIGDRKHGWPENIRAVPVLNHRYVIAYRFTRNPECVVTFILLAPHDELYKKMDSMYRRR